VSKGEAMINAFDPSRLREMPVAEREMVARRERLMGPAYRLFYEHPLQIVRGQGVWLYDAEGKAYLDAYNNVPSVGHCHPAVVEAIARQSAQLTIHTRYLHPAVLDYSERLLATLPAELSQAMYTCSGSEANDLAVRITKQFTGGSGFIVTRLAYHGVTDTISGMSPSLGKYVLQGTHVRSVPAPTGMTVRHSDVGEEFANGVTDALDQMRRDGIRPAGLIVDTIFSSDGVFSDPAGFLQPAVAAIRRAGGLFIADEVQAGFGRLGSAMWGFQRHGLTPDIVTMGKPMGNGYPVAAIVAQPHILAPFGAKARYFNTFGGNPVAMAAANAVLAILAEEGLQDNARITGQYLRERLVDLSTRFETIGQVRGAGLFIGVELVTDRTTQAPASLLTSWLVNEMRRRHVLISASGPHANVLKIRPPLPFGIDNADFLLSVLESALGAAPPAVGGARAS
jgi:4-aminobutyrate aminotransferase-like enzyme